MKKNTLSTLLLPGIVLLASILRLASLSSIPNALNPDELAIGYNSFAILTTGADEWGHRFPLLLKSFGDWKMVLYPYIAMLPIKLLGLNEFAVRLPNALAGIVNVLLIFGIGLHLFKKKSIALIAALFLAISPWAIFSSRGAFEFNFGIMLFLGGVYSFLLYIQTREKISVLYLSSILFGLSLFSYHAFIVFTPLFVFGMLVLYRGQIVSKKMHLFPIVLFGVFIALSAFFLSQGSVKKASNDTIFSNENTIYRRADRFRTPLAGDNHFINKLLYNRYGAIAYQIGQNYLLSFSPSFLFDTGGQKDFYNMEGFGPLYLVDCVFLVLGFASLLWKKEKSLPFLIMWLLIAPIPSAIASTAPSQTRLVALFPVIILIEAFGVYTIGKYIIEKKSLSYNIAGSVGVVFFLLSFIYFVDMYYYQMNLWRARFFHYGYKQLAEVANKYPNEKIVVRGPENFPYISFLFYNKYDPVKFRQEVQYYPENPDNGFTYVKSFGRYTFVDSIDRSKLEPNTLYFDTPNMYDQKNVIQYPTGDAEFTYFDNSFHFVLQNNAWRLQESGEK